MAAVTQFNDPKLLISSFINKRDKWRDRFALRPCMVVSTSLMVAGFSIPVLMVLQILPLTLLLCLAGFVLVVFGCTMRLIFCGEI